MKGRYLCDMTFRIIVYFMVGIGFNVARVPTETVKKVVVNVYSCIDIYAHNCLKPFSIGRKQCSNSKTHVQIMKFTCRLNMGFGRWDVTSCVL